MMTTTPPDLMDYAGLLQRAHLEVVRNALEQVVGGGLPGDHHFYIAFRTDEAGVDIPDFLRAQHPHEMTIVLQYDFQDLTVMEESFSVTLHFSGRPAHLSIPFTALCGFFDPSVQFGLQLREDSGDAGEQTRAKDTTRDDGDSEGDAAVAPKAGETTAEVVTLDAFRKK